MKQILLFTKLLFLVFALQFINGTALAERPVNNQASKKAGTELDKLNQLEWQRRLILVKSENTEKIKTILFKHEEAINERKISWFILANDKLYSNYPENIGEGLVNEVQGILNYLENDNFILVGYDGEIKSTDNGLTISRVFEQIDSMPIRQLEMSEQ